MISQEEQTRRQLAQLPLEKLWDMAHLHFSFRDDAPSDSVTGANLVRKLACELTGYDDFYNRAIPPLPSEPLWYLGHGSTAAYEDLKARFPGIISYLAQVSSHPPRNLWNQVARFDLWATFEGLLKSAAATGHVIENWLQVEQDLRVIAAQEHLNKRKAAQA
jgi:hypothetical protein